MQSSRYLGVQKVKKVEGSKIFFAFSAFAFGTSLVSILVAILMPSYGLTMSPASYRYGTLLLPSFYYSSPAETWIIAVSPYVFIAFSAIGILCALLGIRYYDRDILSSLVKDVGTYFKSSSIHETEKENGEADALKSFLACKNYPIESETSIGVLNSFGHGQVFTDKADGLAMELKVIADRNDVQATNDHMASDLGSMQKDWPNLLFVVHDDNGSIEKPDQFCKSYNIDENTWRSRCIVIEH